MTTVLLRSGVVVLATAVVIGCAGRQPGPRAAVAPAGGPQPRGLATGSIERVALAGDAALIARVGVTGSSMRSRVTVTRVPLAGSGRSPTTLRWPKPPTGGLRVLSMDASPAAVALTVTTADDEQGGPVSGLFGGPATGPVRELEPVRAADPDTRVPRSVQVDGELLFVGESGSNNMGLGPFAVRGLAGPARRVDLPADAQGATFAGDLVAYAEAPLRSPGDPGATDLDALLPRRVVVREWRTGAQRTAFSIGRGIAGLALSRSGAVAVGESRGGVLELRPGRPLRRIARSQPAPWPGVTPVYAGERLVLVRRRRAFGPERLVIAEPDGRMRAFGVPSRGIGALAADERWVLWGPGAFAGCAVVAGVRAPAAEAIAPGGPCTRTVINFERSGAQGQRSTLRSGNRAGLALECVAAAAPGCRGVVRLLTEDEHAASAPLRFTVPAGRSRRLVVQLTPDARARVLREGEQLFTVMASAVDPDGRRSQHRGELTVRR
jgi:hypothetical protein